MAPEPHVLMNFDEVRPMLVAQLHEIWVKWMIDKGYADHPYQGYVTGTWDRDGFHERTVCKQCDLAWNKHHRGMVAHDKLPESVRKMYTDMAQMVFVVGHEIGEKSKSWSDLMNAVREANR